VLVTGATSGLGRAMAEALAEAGARVAITSQDRLRANDLVRDRGWGVLAWPVSAGGGQRRAARSETSPAMARWVSA
jgi:NAD(P)-dependent dehydrogenase (short-subunit alcohol dehydrogenase family)